MGLHPFSFGIVDFGRSSIVIQETENNPGIVPPWLLPDDVRLPVLPLPPCPPDWDVMYHDHGDGFGDGRDWDAVKPPDIG